MLCLHASHSYEPKQFTKPIGGLILGVLLMIGSAFFFRTEPPFSRIVLALSTILIFLLVLAERALIAKFTGRNGRSAEMTIDG